MDTENYNLAGQIFLEATAVAAPERDGFVRAHCGQDDELYEVVMEMLQYDSPDDLDESSRVTDEQPVEHSDDISLPARTRLGDYELIEPLGRGGMGVVYRARQVSLNRVVALKVIRSALLATSHDVRRFRFEAEAASELEHPAIVPIYQVGRHSEYHFYSMKLVEGVPLTEWLSQSRPSVEARVTLVVRLAEAIHHAHERGVIHRDLKPANILVDANDSPHIIDFGIARRVDGEGGMTMTGQLLGTPNYMAPELVAPGKQRPTFAVDVYGLGTLLYELLTGHPPFESNSVLETLHRVLNSDPTAPRNVNSEIDQDLQVVVLKCLEKRPANRYESAAALAAELRRWLAGEPILARQATFRHACWKWMRRHPAVAGLLVAVLVVGVVGFATTLWQWRSAVQANAAALAHAASAEQAEQAATRLATTERQAREESQRRFIALCWREVERAFEKGRAGDALAWNLEAIRARSRTEFTPSALTRIEALRLARWLEVQPDLLGAWNFPSAITRVCSARDGDWKVVGTAEGDCFLCGPPGAAGPSDTPELHRLEYNLTAFDCSEEGRYLAGIDETARLVVIDLRTMKQSLLKDLPGGVVSFDFEAGANSILCGFQNGSLCRIDFSEESPTVDEILEHDGLRDIVCDPAGRTVVLVDAEQATLWNSTTWRKIREIPLASKSPMVVYSPTGNTLLATSDQSSYSASVDVYQLPDGDAAGQLQCGGHLNTVCFLGESPVTGDFSHAVRIWDKGTNGFTSRLLQHGSSIRDVVVSADESLLAVSETSGTTHLYEVSDDFEKRFTLNHPVESSSLQLDSSASSLLLATGSVLSRWTLRANARSVRAIPDEGGRFVPREFLDDHHVLTVAASNEAQLIDLRDGSVAARFPHSARVLFAKVLHDTPRVITGDQSGQIRIWRLDNEPITIATHEYGQPLIRCQRTPLHGVLAIQKADGTLTFLDVDAQKAPLPDIPLGRRRDHLVPLQFKEEPQTPPIWMVTRVQGRRWSLETGELLGTVASGYATNGMLLDEQAGRWILGMAGGQLELRDSALELLESVKAHLAPIYRMVWSPVGDTFATCSGDGTAAMWQVGDTFEKLVTLRHEDRVRSVEFHPDGSILLTSSFDGTVRLWDVVTGAMIGPPLSFDAHVHHAQFSPDATGIFINYEPFQSLVYDVPVVRGNRGSLFSRALATSARRPDRTLTLIPMDPQSWFAAWRDVQPDRTFDVGGRALPGPSPTP